MRKVYVENSDQLISDMFTYEDDWTVTSNLLEADMLCLEGGADISPFLYEEETEPMTMSDWKKDVETLGLITMAVSMGIPIVGICRGAQMLCAATDGKLRQHVVGHNNLTEVLDYDGKMHKVSSDHHQVCVPSVNSTELIKSSGVCKSFYDSGLNVLGYQPHPEWSPHGSDGRELFFKLIKDHLVF